MWYFKETLKKLSINFKANKTKYRPRPSAEFFLKLLQKEIITCTCIYIYIWNCWMMCNKCIYLKNLSLNPFPSHRLYFKLLPLPWRQRRINLPTLAREKHRLKLSTREAEWVRERERAKWIITIKEKQAVENI